MKKYKNYIIIAVIIAAIIVAVVLYLKENTQKKIETVLTLDFDGSKAKKYQRVYLENSNDDLMLITYKNNRVQPVQRDTVTNKDKLYFVGRYNDGFIVRKSGWFFDKYYIAFKHQLV